MKYATKNPIPGLWSRGLHGMLDSPRERGAEW
jgi:hypothetical protein